MEALRKTSTAVNKRAATGTLIHRYCYCRLDVEELSVAVSALSRSVTLAG